MVISVDTGNKMIKTEHYEFNSGIDVLDTIPGENDEVIEFGGKYYRTTNRRISYMEDKTEDDRYYILTLIAIARVRDHDNYEEKHVQDIITNFFLQSDSGLYTNTCHVTRMGEEDRTLLYVMDSSKFPAWISDFGKETGIEKNHE